MPTVVGMALSFIPRGRTLPPGPPGTIRPVVDGDGASQPLHDALALVAPGTALRKGLDRILQANTGR